MKLKRIVCAAAAIAFTLPFAACGSEETDPIDDNYRNWYEVFVRSFWDHSDDDGSEPSYVTDDGVGDLRGVTQKLDYVKEMGFNGIWLMPVCQSNTYHGYDVTDYYTVESDYGTNDDFKELVREAHSRGINIIVDMVFNHSSISHPWYKKAVEALKNGETSGENAKYIDYYNFSETQSTGYSSVGNGLDLYYECRFDTAMPDLNLDSEAVRGELAEIMEFWLNDMDVDGFRLDACTSYYTGNVDKNVEFLSFVNTTAKSIKSDAYIVGEVWEGTDTQIRAYYESGIDSCFLFTASAGAAGISTVKSTLSSIQSKPGEYFTDLLLDYQRIYDKGSQAPFLCNHDTSRAANMFVGEMQIKMAAGLLSLMNGNVFVYYGDEIGMVCKSADSDPTKRIPMRWSENDMAIGQVFIPPQPGVAIGADAYRYPSVEVQQEDEFSILNYYKKAMNLRHRHPEIARGTVEALIAPNPYVAAFKKTYDGKSVIVLVNLSDSESTTVSLSDYGDVKVKDLLDAGKSKSSSSNKSVELQPYSIAVLR